MINCWQFDIDKRNKRWYNMSRKKGHDTFSQGKNKRGDIHVGFVGEPKTNFDTYHKTKGHFIRRRKFGDDGYAIKDYDMADDHKSYDHVHDISRDKGRNPLDRYPNKKEKSEIRKAKKKRRFWK